jgi:hypothetical protein
MRDRKWRPRHVVEISVDFTFVVTMRLIIGGRVRRRSHRHHLRPAGVGSLGLAFPNRFRIGPGWPHAPSSVIMTSDQYFSMTDVEQTALYCVSASASLTGTRHRGLRRYVQPQVCLLRRFPPRGLGSRDKSRSLRHRSPDPTAETPPRLGAGPCDDTGCTRSSSTHSVGRDDAFRLTALADVVAFPHGQPPQPDEHSSETFRWQHNRRSALRKSQIVHSEPRREQRSARIARWTTVDSVTALQQEIPRLG